MTPLERTCRILETLLLNGAMKAGTIAQAIGADPWVTHGDLVALRELGFVEYVPSEVMVSGWTTGPRLELAIEARKVSA